MRKLVYIPILIAAALPAPAAAEDLSPTPAELAYDHAVALAYWKVELNPPVVMVSLPLPWAAAQANYLNGGAIELSSERDWRDFPEETCRLYVHEYGHLVLGPTYFAATNPSDPAHSPDPNNIMYGGGEPKDGPPATWEQELRQSRSIGCFEPLVASPAPKSHPKRKHHRLHRKTPGSLKHLGSVILQHHHV